jgi:hypothetical protein
LGGIRIALIRRRLIALDEIRRNAGRRTGDAVGEYGYALTRQLLLAVEHVGIEHFGGIELAAFGASAEDRQQHEQKRKR